MNADYSDIRDRIPEPPLWFDEHAVPRYMAFAPDLAANIYATEIVLLEVTCQACERAFKVCLSWDLTDQARGVQALSTQIRAQEIDYGDPPNVGCCAAGPTMTSVPRRVLEFWKNARPGWVREHELEVAIDCAWAREDAT